MQMIVLGTDHNLQPRDQGLKELIVDLAVRKRVTMIAEENRIHSSTVAQEVAESMALAWVQIDMSTEERVKAGIFDKLSDRMQIRGYDAIGVPIVAIRYAPVEDGIREEFWLDRIEEAGSNGTVLVICGCLHRDPFSEKAMKRGHDIVSKLFHPESLSEIKPELF